jgi:hypothetical protein
MEQRSLRLGDIVDDYCPRERRLTNHAIVAIVEDAIRQTRCTTCDYEHVYKQAREPRRRKPPAESLYDQVLADVAGGQLVAARAAAVEPAPAAVEASAIAADTAPSGDDATADRVPVDEGWPAHRTLIRATLPKTSDDPPPPRPIPEFTMHQKPQGRARHVRVAYGPQGDPFGRPMRGPGHHVPGRGGNGNGNTVGAGPGGDPGSRRGRRRRGGKRGR